MSVAYGRRADQYRTRTMQILVEGAPEVEPGMMRARGLGLPMALLQGGAGKSNADVA